MTHFREYVLESKLEASGEAADGKRTSGVMKDAKDVALPDPAVAVHRV